MKVIFCENLRLIDLINYGLKGLQVYYGSRSLFARISLKLLNVYGLNLNITQIELGHVRSIMGIRRNAYKNAEKYVDALGCKEWAKRLADDLGFDYWLFVQKYFFDKFYLRFEFFELALRYAQENSDKNLILSVSNCHFNDFYREKLGCVFKVKFQSSWKLSKFLASILLLPPLAIACGFLKREDEELHFEKQIICEVDGKQTLEIFRELFSGVPQEQLAFVTERRHLLEFDNFNEIHILGLNKKARRHIIYAALLIGLRSVRFIKQLSSFDGDLFYIFYDYVRGKAGTINGSGNIYCTYEHLVTVKAVRNELLHSSGNISIFVPGNTYVTNQYYHSEFMLNYDVVLSAGKHFEDIYPRKRPKTQIYLPTGCYASHRMLIKDAECANRQAKLEEFKEKNILVLVISPGICPQTLNIERELMTLSRNLSQLKDVKLILRLKPVKPLPMYKDFYKNQLHGIENILVTSGEYDLFDFVGVADLVVTSISNAAYDLAQTGLPVMFVDYFKDAADQEYLPCWFQEQGFPLAEKTAMDTIINWVKNNNQEREEWSMKMIKFVDYFAYRHPDFDTYRQCVQNYVQEAKAKLVCNDINS